MDLEQLWFLINIYWSVCFTEVKPRLQQLAWGILNPSLFSSCSFMCSFYVFHLENYLKIKWVLKWINTFSLDSTTVQCFWSLSWHLGHSVIRLNVHSTNRGIQTTGKKVKSDRFMYVYMKTKYFNVRPFKKFSYSLALESYIIKNVFLKCHSIVSFFFMSKM